MQYFVLQYYVWHLRRQIKYSLHIHQHHFSLSLHIHQHQSKQDVKMRRTDEISSLHLLEDMADRGLKHDPSPLPSCGNSDKAASFRGSINAYDVQIKPTRIKCPTKFETLLIISKLQIIIANTNPRLVLSRIRFSLSNF